MILAHSAAKFKRGTQTVLYYYVIFIKYTCIKPPLQIFHNKLHRSTLAQEEDKMIRGVRNSKILG
jgi:hypothetical protein